MTMGGRTLFENASFKVNYGDRVALVGPNGAGKSTLFSLILKKNEPDTGTIERDEWTMVGYLPQEAEAQGDEVTFVASRSSRPFLLTAQKETAKRRRYEKAPPRKHSDIRLCRD